MTQKYLSQLNDEQFKCLLKTLKFPIYETGFRQGTKKLQMTEGSIALFSYNFSDEQTIYLKDFKVRYTQKRKLPHELPVDRKRTEELFIFMIEKFEDYYGNAKFYWREDKFLLRILNRAYRKVKLSKQSTKIEVESEKQ